MIQKILTYQIGMKFNLVTEYFGIFCFLTYYEYDLIRNEIICSFVFLMIFIYFALLFIKEPFG